MLYLFFAYSIPRIFSNNTTTPLSLSHTRNATHSPSSPIQNTHSIHYKQGRKTAIFVFGKNEDGRLGVGDKEDRDEPTRVKSKTMSKHAIKQVWL